MKGFRFKTLMSLDPHITLYRAYTQSGLTMTALAAEIGLTVARVSQLIARAKRLREKN